VKYFAKITIPFSSNILVMFAKTYFMSKWGRLSQCNILASIVDRYELPGDEHERKK